MPRAIDALVDGVPGHLVPIDDRGLQYGHGMFETCRIIEAQIPLWPYHHARLKRASDRLRIPVDLELIDAEVAALAARQRDGIVKVVVTAGAGRGYAATGASPRRVISLLPPGGARSVGDAGMTVRMCRTRLAVQPALAGLKHLNRLEQILARSEWQDPDIGEGLMCDMDGNLIEGTSTNLFLVFGSRIATASLDRCGVAGVLRQVLIDERPGLNTPIEVRDISINELDDADECFLTNAVTGIMPVGRIIDRVDARLRTGPVARAIAAAVEARFGIPVSH